VTVFRAIAPSDAGGVKRVGLVRLVDLEAMQHPLHMVDEVVGEIQHFSGLALTSGNRAREFRLWPLVNGLWQEPVPLNFSAEEAESRPLDESLRDRLDGALTEPVKNGNKLEHLAIFSRWYFSTSRDGHWYPFRTLAELNYRRLVRQISKMAQSAIDKSI